MDREQPDNQPPSSSTLDPEDYYFEGDNMVFTASYHLKRGYCCGSGCRHCPYGNAPSDNAQGADDPALPPKATG